MKHAIAVLVVVLAVAAVSAQDYYYGAEPAPSMYAQQAGSMPPLQQQMPYGAMPYGAPAAYMPQPQPAFVEQQLQQQAYAPFPQDMEEEEEGELSEVADEAEAENEAEEAHEEEGEAEAEGEQQIEGEQESEEGSEESDEMRFQQTHGPFKRLKKKVKKLFRKAKRKGRQAVAAAKKFLKKLVGGGKTSKKKKKGGAKPSKVVMSGKRPKASNSWFKPTVGKKKNKLKRTPNAKTPKSAGGKPLPPMPAPLPKPKKINCKKDDDKCITAETPAEGEEPGDHSPKAVFKKKMEVIKKALTDNNRNLAAEAKWLDQVDLIMKQYALKVKKVKEHMADERKSIKELLRQRRIVLNEKKQKELEAKLKMATTELTALTDALKQVETKESELGNGKTQLASKIKLLVADLGKLRTDKANDEAQALKKAD